jgi:ribosomal protein S18 acetylase RimI-like enzyme
MTKPLQAAAQLLWSNSCESQRSSGQSEPAFDTASLLAATRDGHLVGILHFQMGKGRIGWLQSPVLADAHSADAGEIKQSLICAGVQRLCGQGARLVQALLPCGDACSESLMACSFRRLTDLVEMKRPLSAPATFQLAAELEFVPFTESLAGELCHVIELTYRDSLDCPELDGIRPVEEVLEGYRAAGDFRRDLWLLVRAEGKYVGCVLMSYVAECEMVSLQYMGVVPSHRRSGIGRQITQRAIAGAAHVGAASLHLAVDARNSRAWQMYRELGFREVDRRTAYIFRCETSSDASPSGG